MDGHMRDPNVIRLPMGEILLAMPDVRQRPGAPEAAA